MTYASEWSTFCLSPLFPLSLFARNRDANSFNAFGETLEIWPIHYCARHRACSAVKMASEVRGCADIGNRIAHAQPPVFTQIIHTCFRLRVICNRWYNCCEGLPYWGVQGAVEAA